MRKLKSLAMVFGSLALLLTLALAQTGNPLDVPTYTATMTVVSSGSSSQGSATIKMYKSGDKMRMDFSGMSGGGGRAMPPGAYVVYMLTTRQAFLVMPSMNMCMTTPLPAQAQNPMTADPSAKIERSTAGTETVEGHVCTVENITVITTQGPQAGKSMKAKVWEAQDLKGFPIKMVVMNDDGSTQATSTYTNISLDAPADSVFAKPANCMASPAGMGRGGNL